MSLPLSPSPNPPSFFSPSEIRHSSLISCINSGLLQSVFYFAIRASALKVEIWSCHFLQNPWRLPIASRIKPNPSNMVECFGPFLCTLLLLPCTPGTPAFFQLLEMTTLYPAAEILHTFFYQPGMFTLLLTFLKEAALHLPDLGKSSYTLSWAWELSSVVTVAVTSLCKLISVSLSYWR